jgi:hypothetical protein
MQCNFAILRVGESRILHQFAVFSPVLTPGDFLCHTDVNQALYLTVDIVHVAVVAENILS